VRHRAQASDAAAAAHPNNDGLGLVVERMRREDMRGAQFARRIAALPSVTSLLIKESVNQTVDNMGFYNALNACFSLHQINHAHWAELHGKGMAVAEPEDGVPSWRDAPPIVRARKDRVRD